MSPLLYGLMAEFRDPEHLVKAAQRAHQEGYRQMDAYSPFPVDGLSEALGLPRTRLPAIVFAAALTGALAGYGMQYYAAVYSYPINSGGRPFHSWPAFIPVAFEMTILFGAIAAVLALLFLNRLPQPYHPVFNAPSFKRASQDGFFLCLEARDPRFDLGKTRRFLQELSGRPVIEVKP